MNLEISGTPKTTTATMVMTTTAPTGAAFEGHGPTLMAWLAPILVLLLLILLVLLTAYRRWWRLERRRGGGRRRQQHRLRAGGGTQPDAPLGSLRLFHAQVARHLDSGPRLGRYVLVAILFCFDS